MKETVKIIFKAEDDCRPLPIFERMRTKFNETSNFVISSLDYYADENFDIYHIEDTTVVSTYEDDKLYMSGSGSAIDKAVSFIQSALEIKLKEVAQ